MSEPNRSSTASTGAATPPPIPMPRPPIDLPKPSVKREAESGGLGVPVQIFVSQIINSLLVGVLFAGAAGLVLPRMFRGVGVSLKGSEIAYLLAFIAVLIALLAYLVFSGIYQIKAEKAAKARASQRARQGKRRRPKDWGDFLEERLDGYDSLFPAAAQPKQPQAPSEPEPEVKTLEPGAVPFEQRNIPVTPIPTQQPIARPIPSAIMPATTSNTPAIAGTPAVPLPPDPVLMTFAERAHEMVTVDSLEFSDRDRFGLHLFIAGGCGELAQRRGWTGYDGIAALANALVQIGMPREYADGFADSANLFAQVQVLRPMVDGGAAAMKIWYERRERSHNGEEAFYGMSMLFTGWGSVDTITPPERVFLTAVAVDVSSLDGEAISQETHSAILRGTKNLIEGIVTRTNGAVVRDVHTGLAARFGYTEAAVRAATAIQESAFSWSRGWDKYRITLQVAVDSVFAASVGDVFISAGLQRLVRLLILTPHEHILCTETVRNEALDGDQFQAQVLPEAPADMPALFSIPWVREQAPAESKPVEYRQIGGTGGETLKVAQQTAALDEWLRQAGVNEKPDA